ncbi:inorganic phosphate transporter Pho88 [Hyaloraphidium curvatum]|nr:inorganic phosphate transporter Pho88 [Hyaloraphidium curvatum]
MRFVNNLDWTNPTYILVARVLYLVSMLAQVYVMWKMHSSIFRQKDFKTLTYFLPGNSWMQIDDKLVNTTNEEYDREKLTEAFRAFLFPALLTLFAHFRWGYVQPLILQIFVPWRQYFNLPIFRVHVLGEKAEGDLRRPWKGGMDSMLQGGTAPRQMSEKEYERMLKNRAKTK